ncbi:hypothetical protein [Dyadobacter sp. BHUBP1]|uniref:hypothetical protein n=1 Tax=Dyadobacter sp. BHUBP1 TaxID=3424178 RepID=UPI003D351755
MKLSHFHLVQRGVLFVLTFLTVLSCNRDANSILDPSNPSSKTYRYVSPQEAESFVINNRVISAEDTTFFSKIKILWNKTYRFENKDGDFLVVPTEHNTIIQEYLSARGDIQEREFPPINLVVYRDSTGKMNANFLLVASQSETKTSEKNWIKSFTGALIYYNLDGTVARMQSFDLGKRHYSKKDRPATSNPTARCRWMNECFYIGQDHNATYPGANVFGHYGLSELSCVQFMAINGITFTLNSTDVTSSCVEEDVDPVSPPAPTTPISGGGGGGTPSDNPTVSTSYNNSPGEPAADISVNRGIDCASFDFTRTANNWMEAGVKNFRLQFVNISTGEVKTLTINRALVIGYPMARQDGTLYSYADASTMAAAAFQTASKKTIGHWANNLLMNEYQVETLFINWLKAAVIANGGTVGAKGSTTSVIINANPQYATVGNGECN